MKSFVYGSLALAVLAGTSSVFAAPAPPPAPVRAAAGAIAAKQTTAATIAATPQPAAPTPPPPPPPSPAEKAKAQAMAQEAANQMWSGLFAGFNVGYAWSGQSVAQSGYPSFGATGPAFIAGEPSGALGGFEANYNYGLYHKYIVGVAGDFDWASVYSNQSLNATGPGVTYLTSASQNLVNLATVRALVGYTPSSYSVLLYLTGGLAYGRVLTQGEITNPDCVFFCSNTEHYQSSVGWVAGAGLDYALTSYWIVKFEYLYYDVGTHSQALTDPSFPAAALNQQVAYHGNIVRGGIDYKFM